MQDGGEKVATKHGAYLVVSEWAELYHKCEPMCSAVKEGDISFFITLSDSRIVSFCAQSKEICIPGSDGVPGDVEAPLRGIWMPFRAFRVSFRLDDSISSCRSLVAHVVQLAHVAACLRWSRSRDDVIFFTSVCHTCACKPGTMCFTPREEGNPLYTAFLPPLARMSS